MSSAKTYRIMISGGGTGGHIFPAISIAQALEERLDNPKILFVGAKGKMEMKKVPEAGFEIVGLWISGIQRKLSIRNLLFPLKIVFSLIKSFSLISRFKPDVVIGVGGYASGPILYAAALKKVPTLIQEQNSYAGLTNKWLSKRVNKICVAHEGMEKYFPENKLVVTGNPVRSGIVLESTVAQEAFEFFGFDSSIPVIFMTGGSLGARTLNEAMLANLDEFTSKGVQVIWQCGGFYLEEMKTRVSDMDMTGVWLGGFLKDMDKAYAISDVVIARAGALSIAELELTGKAAILIPSPNVAQDHQTKNARALVERNAAVLIPDSQAVDVLGQETMSLLQDKERIGLLQTNIAELSHPRAQEAIAEEVIKLVA